jgi:hypothetical protein
MDNDEKEVYKMLGEFSENSKLLENIGDNTVDNLMDELNRGVKIELGKFVGSLLNTGINRFLHSYNLPQYEGFRSAMINIIDRFRVMDGADQGDLFRKIDNMFRDIFISQYGHLGPEIAEMIAKKYAVQMIDFIKSYSVMPPDSDIDKKEVYY